MEHFTQRLRSAMQKAHITQAELCAKTGISRSTMSQYCSGAFLPKRAKLQQIAQALDVKEAWLLGYDDTPIQPVAFEKYPNLRPIHLRKFPVLGEIACGTPIFAQEDKDAFITADADIHADFCLIAKGDSMIGARIFDGDTVFIRKQPMVDNGEIAAVIIDEEATLKRVYYDPKNARLQLVAENPAYPPLVYMREELDYIHILGKAIGFMSMF